MVKHNFRQLNIWKDAVKLAKDIFDLTQAFSSEHKFGISSQMFRAAVSISSNIAEGCSRSSQKEIAHFLRMSIGSAFELETQLLIALECNLASEVSIEPIVAKVQTLQKQIAAFCNTIEK